MNIRTLAAVLIVPVMLLGCASQPYANDNKPLSLGQLVATKLINSIHENRALTSCVERRQNSGTASNIAISDCRRLSKELAFTKTQEERKERKQKTEALHSAFNNRGSDADTATMIEQKKQENDWFSHSERESIIVIKDNSFD